MNRMMLLITALLIGGCASIPPDLRAKAEHTLLPFSSTVTTEPSNQIARWGGEIARISNLQQGSLLEVVEFSLNSSGRPVKADTSGGRFRVLISDFLDPAIYAPGRLITVLGTFSAIEADKVGEQAYLFPILHSEQLHLWPEIEEPSNCNCNYDPFSFHRSFMMRPIIIVPAD